MRRRTAITAILAAVVVLAGCAGGAQFEATDATTEGNSTHTPGSTLTPSDSGGAQTVTTERAKTPTRTVSEPVASEPESSHTPESSTDGGRRGEADLIGTVTDVVDGDTVEVRVDGEVRTVRLLAVDTPEKTPSNEDPSEYGVTTESGERCLLRYANDATRYMSQSLDGERVALLYDANEPETDVYGRTLAYVYVNGELFNDDLVKRGLARVYTEADAEREDEFLAYERRAKQANEGLWACDDAQSTIDRPADGRTSLAVTEIHADAPGNDNDNKNGEWVVVTNEGNEAMDLTGYVVSDEAGHAYVFPDGFTLDAGRSVTLHTGSGTDTATELYWNYGGATAVWNNGGDTVTVTDDRGNVVASRQYDG